MISPEAIFDRIVYSDVQRRAAKGQARTRLSPSQRTFQEPFFNFLGAFIGKVWTSAPFSWRRRMDPWLCQSMGGHASLPQPLLVQRIDETIRLARQLREQTNRWPAFLFLTSHPVTEGPLAWMRFEMLCQGLAIAFALSAEGRRQGFETHPPQCILAVDPYALDSVSVPIGAIYAAFIHQVYFAYDRQASTQSALQRQFFLKGAGYPTAGWRFLSRLSHGVPLLMALGGGLPVNARLYYAAREFVQRLPLPRIRKRQAEYDWVRLLETKGHEDPAIDGQVSVPLQQTLRRRLEEWGLSSSDANLRLEQFLTEFKQKVPNRERLWSVLYRRLVARGQGVIVMAAQHHEFSASIEIAAPQALEAGDAAGRRRFVEAFSRFYI